MVIRLYFSSFGLINVVTLNLKIRKHLRWDSLVAQTVKRLPAMQETRVRSPGREDSPGEGNGNPLQYFCLENSMDGGAWWAMVHGVTKSQTLATLLVVDSDGCIFPFLLWFLLLFFSQLLVRSPQTTQLSFYISSS